jgi:hypothetical protein
MATNRIAGRNLAISSCLINCVWLVGVALGFVEVDGLLDLILFIHALILQSKPVSQFFDPR